MRCMKLVISTRLGLYLEVHFHAKLLFLALIVHHIEVFKIRVLDEIKHGTPDRVPVFSP